MCWTTIFYSHALPEKFVGSVKKYLGVYFFFQLNLLPPYSVCSQGQGRTEGGGHLGHLPQVQQLGAQNFRFFLLGTLVCLT